MSQSLALAYGLKRKNAKKMAQGGMVENEKIHPEHEAEDSVGKIVQSLLSDHMGYSDGGMVDDMSGHEMEMMSESGDDFLSHDNDHSDDLAIDRMPEGMNESEDGADMMEMKKKKILASVLDSLR